MVLTGSYFTYAGVNSEQYGLQFMNLDSTNYPNLEGEVSVNTIYNKHSNKRTVIQRDFSNSPMSFNIDILTTHNLSVANIKDIEKWLFNKKTYYKLYIKNDKETREIINNSEKRLYLNCMFINPTKIEYSGRIVGWNCTVECDSPLAWQEAITQTWSFSGSPATVTVNVDSNLNDYIYPKMTVQMNSTSGDLVIENLTDSENRQMSFDNLPANQQVIIDGSTNYISGSLYSYLEYHNFPRLVDGANTVKFTGNVSSVTIEWQNRRFL